jgi:hypothetical protein
MIQNIKIDPTHLRPRHRIFVFGSSAVFLIGYLALVIWFRTTNVYHHHFFESGLIVVAYNCARILFIGYLLWLIYATGRIVLGLLRAPLSSFSIGEGIVIACCVGTGLWHVVMHIVGTFGLLYWQFMTTVSFCILLLSVPLFQKILFLKTSVNVRFGSGYSSDIGHTLRFLYAALLLISISALLITRALYPGGGHDYYTHYFYYYHDVIAHHGTAPNDVWYQYYYSKGAGLFFFATLLTGPQGPELVSFCHIVIAAIAIGTLITVLAPGTFWAPTAIILYFLFYIVPLAGSPYSSAGPGGEFQKLHEITSACVVLALCVICLARRSSRQVPWPYYAAGIASAVTASILTPPVGILLGIVFGCGMLSTAWRKDHLGSAFYVNLSLSAFLSVAIVLIQNYLTTGLASDQFIDFMWHWSNVERLYSWGVVPVVIITSWIRDNYAEQAVPLGLPSLYLLADYVRVPAIWPIFATGVIAGAGVYQRTFWANQATARVFLALCGFVTVFAVLAILLGRSQIFSLFRLTTFFFPILMLVGILGWILFAKANFTRPAVLLFLPFSLLLSTLFVWSNTFNWLTQAAIKTRYAEKFLLGEFSLADAYSHQVGQDTLAYGAIHPGTLKAAQVAGADTRIWSMHTHSYCMAPGCRVESVVSFKMSSYYDKILTGSADTAKALLKKEGLNYFLISKDLVLIDLLQYSDLFSPANIAKHLAVRWTDGTTYLLTWPNDKTEPISTDFVNFYQKKIDTEKHSVFKFEPLILQLAQVMKMLEEGPQPWQPVRLPWSRWP